MHGEIVGFLDSDDAFLPNMVEVMVNQMRKANANIIVCGFYIFNEEINPPKYKDIKLFEEGLYTSQNAQNRLISGLINHAVWNKMYERHVFSNVRFTEDHFAEDRLITPYVFNNAEKIMVISVPLMNYRVRSNSISHTYTEKFLSDWLYADIMEQEFVSKHSPSLFSKETVKSFRNNRFDRLIITYLCFRYTRLKSRPISEIIRMKYESEIKKRASDKVEYTYKTRLLYCTYCINQFLCYLIVQGIRHLRK